MINKKRKILSGIAILLILVASGIVINFRSYPFSVNLFKSGQGWGYDIKYRSKVLIHQPYMPAVEGKIAFQNKRAAKKTGLLVVKKLRNKQQPTIKIEELTSIIKNTN
jgi:hypothetical protein